VAATLASPRQLRFAWLTELVRAIHTDSRGTYGWRRVNAELRYGHHVVVNPRPSERSCVYAACVGCPERASVPQQGEHGNHR
jgi:putative transposase